MSEEELKRCRNCDRVAQSDTPDGAYCHPCGYAGTDHPTYISHVTVRALVGDDYEMEAHALVYMDGKVALTLFEGEYATWSAETGAYLGGGNLHGEGDKLTAESVNLIQRRLAEPVVVWSPMENPLHHAEQTCIGRSHCRVRLDSNGLYYATVSHPESFNSSGHTKVEDAKASAVRTARHWEKIFK